jgi:excisionase family DNA binding protein
VTLADLPELIKPKELSEYLRISLAQAYNLAYTKKIQTVRIGRSPRFKKESVEKFVAKGGYS